MFAVQDERAELRQMPGRCRTYWVNQLVLIKHMSIQFARTDNLPQILHDDFEVCQVRVDPLARVFPRRNEHGWEWSRALALEIAVQ